MPVTLRDLQKPVGVVLVEYGEHLIEVHFKPTIITVDWAESRESLSILLGQALVWWDVLDDAGHALVPTACADPNEQAAQWAIILRTIPLGLLYSLEKAVLAAVRTPSQFAPHQRSLVTLAA